MNFPRDVSPLRPGTLPVPQPSRPTPEPQSPTSPPGGESGSPSPSWLADMRADMQTHDAAPGGDFQPPTPDAAVPPRTSASPDMATAREASLTHDLPAGLDGLQALFTNAATQEADADAVLEKAQAHVGAVQRRIDRYHRDFELDRSIGALQGDPSVVYVADEFPRQWNFVHEGKDTQTHFDNLYHLAPDSDGKVIAQVVAQENYKSPLLDFFASDAMLAQLASVASGRRSGAVDLLADLPVFPPRAIVRDTIDNAVTKEALLRLNPEMRPEVTVEHGSPALAALLATPNGKATLNFIKEYNQINAARQIPPVEIDNAVVYKRGDEPGSGWKLQINTAFPNR